MYSNNNLAQPSPSMKIKTMYIYANSISMPTNLNYEINNYFLSLTEYQSNVGISNFPSECNIEMPLCDNWRPPHPGEQSLAGGHNKANNIHEPRLHIGDFIAHRRQQLGYPILDKRISICPLSFRPSSVLSSFLPFVMLRLPPLDSETGWTEDYIL